MSNPHPAGAASPMACAALYHIPIRRLLEAIRQGDCESPRRVGRRSILTYAAVQKYLESFPHRSINGESHHADPESK
jgi:hypothetical protein